MLSELRQHGEEPAGSLLLPEEEHPGPQQAGQTGRGGGHPAGGP